MSEERSAENDATWPTRLEGTCRDCGTTTTCEHPGGLGDEGLGWACPVCGTPVRMDGSGYIRVTSPATGREAQP